MAHRILPILLNKSYWSYWQRNSSWTLGLKIRQMTIAYAELHKIEIALSFALPTAKLSCFMTRVFVSLGEIMRPYIYRRADCSDWKHFKVCLCVHVCVCVPYSGSQRLISLNSNWFAKTQVELKRHENFHTVGIIHSRMAHHQTEELWIIR